MKEEFRPRSSHASGGATGLTFTNAKREFLVEEESGGCGVIGCRKG